MFEGTDDKNNCPGCGESISEVRIAKHIETCERYRADIYRQISRLDPKVPHNVLKVQFVINSSSKKN